MNPAPGAPGAADEGEPEASSSPSAAKPTATSPAEARAATAERTSAQLPHQREGDEARPQLAAVVFNPAKIEERVLREAVSAAEERAGWQPSLWFETTEAEPGASQAREALERGAAVVIAAGGDGTVREVAGVLRDTDATLAIVPAGTGNILARNLDIPLERVDEAVAAAFAGHTRRIDTANMRVRHVDGEMRTHLFLVMAGVGLDAFIIQNTQDHLKKRIGWLAYVDSGLRSLTGHKRFEVAVEFDHRVRAGGGVSSLVFANCGTLQLGARLVVTGGVDDGILDVLAVRPKGFLGWLRLWFRVAVENGIILRSPAGRALQRYQRAIGSMSHREARHVRAVLKTPQSAEVDGDVIGEVTAVSVTVLPRSLAVRVPAGPVPGPFALAAADALAAAGRLLPLPRPLALGRRDQG